MKDTDIWEIKQIIQKAMENSHPVPSPETKERLTKLETSMEKMSKDIVEIKVHTTYIKELISKLPCKEESIKIDNLEKEVNQFVGKAAIIGSVFGFVGAVILTIIGWLLTKIKL